MTNQPGDSVGRPAVSVVVPFAGSADEARALVDALLELRLADGDELIVVDNDPARPVASVASGTTIEVLESSGERSSYYARNVGAEAARCDWLLFTDADCRPDPALLDAYFSEPPVERVGALAGSIRAAAQPGLLPRWAASRQLINQELLVSNSGAATANLLVRRSAWEGVGGFHEGVRSGADIEFCWRLQDAGWTLEPRPAATTRHLHRTSVKAVARQFARYGAGNAWQERRRPGSVPGLALGPGLMNCLGAIVVHALTLRPRRAAMRALDGFALVAAAVGRLQGNAASREPRVTAHPPAAERSVVIATDFFPALSETFVGADVSELGNAGWEVRVEAVARPPRPRLGGTRGLAVNYLEDEGTLDRVRAIASLAMRHPIGCVLDLGRRRRFAAEEQMPLRALAPLALRLEERGEKRVHVHFALMAEVNALRAGAIVGARVSVAAHAHEIYVRPRALPEKLARASFAVADCDYTVDHLRTLVPESAGRRIHKIVLGVDTETFRRRRPHPEGRTVVAVGRLVEKKGFPHLIEAAAHLPQESLDKVLIVGDGPMRGELQELIDAHELDGRVQLLGSLEPPVLRELLEQADLLCMPSVIASNGDRDSMPVVVKEALAMEIPVVASDEVGLPEIVEPEWGRLVPPGDAEALADAIAELLALDPKQRAEMGRRGREKVRLDANLAIESSKLARLLSLGE